MVEIEHITKIYKLDDKERKKSAITKALDDVSTVIHDGEFTAFSGPSGSGKTTILNLIGCLDSPTEGKILLDGQDISSLSLKEKTEIRKQKIGFIFQSYNLIPVLTAQENVELALNLIGTYSKEQTAQMAHDILSDVGLDGLQNRKPHQLSGGQQQRVSIARALVKNPSVILADEPTANLDSVNAVKIIELMQEMNVSHNTTFIFSTHDRMVMDHCRRLIHIKDGRLTD